MKMMFIIFKIILEHFIKHLYLLRLVFKLNDLPQIINRVYIFLHTSINFFKVNRKLTFTVIEIKKKYNIYLF